MRTNRWVRTLDHFIEACWLLAIVAIPMFFDTMTVRIFEPDKIALFRNIVLVMVVAVFLRAVLALPAAMARRSAQRREPANGDGETPTEQPRRPWWRAQLAARPLFVPVIIFALIYTAATINSALPGISFWGSYDRMQGLYTWLSYIVFFFILSYGIRSWAQVERIISAMVFASLPVALYGIIQHLQWDPVAWGADTSVRVASSLGNAIFLGAYLIMCMPLAGYRLWRAVERLRAEAAPEPTQQTRRRPQQQGVIEITGMPPIVPVIGYALTLMIDFAALYFTGSRGPYYGFIVAVVVGGFLLTGKLSNPWPAISSLVLALVLYEVSSLEASLAPWLALLICVVAVAVACLALFSPQLIKTARPAVGVIAFVLAIFVFPQTVTILNTDVSSSSSADTSHLTDLAINGTSEVRTLIWKGSIPLIKQRPILGWGPETMIYVYSPYYPPELGHLEHSNAAPDRNHDTWMDFLVFSGLLGLLAWLALIGTFVVLGLKVLQRARSLSGIMVAAAVGAIVAGHMAEATVGIDIVSTLLLLWTMFAVITAFYARPELVGAGQAALEGVAALGAVTATAPARTLVGAGAGGGRGRGGNGPAPRGGNGRRARGQAARGQAARPAPARPSFEELSGGQQAGLLGLIVLTLAAFVGGALLFWNNVQVVRADAAYKQAQGFDSVGSSCLAYARNPSATGTGCPFEGANYTTQQILTAVGQQFLPTAINFYQQAVDAQPNQDYYDDPGLSKTYLDTATYFLQTNNLTDATTQFKLAEQTLMRAMQLNPYNMDHPMNAGRMYSLWARFDASKWALADKYYGKATSWARHNGRWLDEWGVADMGTLSTPGAAQGIPGEAQQAGLKQAQINAIVRKALDAFNRAAAVDDELGDARVLRGDAQTVLGMTTAAAASYREALRVGHFELPGINGGTVLQKLLTALNQTHNYRAMVTPLESGTYQGMAPMTLVYSSTFAMNFTPAFSQTLPGIITTLHQKGLLK